MRTSLLTVSLGIALLFTTPAVAQSQTGSISGRVRDAYGVPLPGARVYVSTLGYRDGRRMLLPALSTQPDGQGYYRITPVPAGEYYLKIEPTTLRGIGAFYPGVADIQKATLVPVQSGQEIVGADFDMPNLPTFKISGKLLNVPPRPAAANGPPATPASAIMGFTFVPADPNNPDLGSAPLLQNASRRSNGEFEISLPAGDWAIYPVIRMNAPGATPAPAQGLPTYATGRARVLIVDRDVENVTITIGSSDVKVRVTGDLPTNPPLRITMAPRENFASPLISHLRSSQGLDANGEFTFKSVPPGKYSVQITPLPATHNVADVRVGTRSVYDDGIITVGLDPLDPVEVVLGQGGGNVQGKVIVPNSVMADVPPGRVVLVPAAPRRNNPFLYKTVPLNLTTGFFAFPNVLAGDYKVFAFQSLPSGGAEQDETFMAKYESFGTPVKVVAGQSNNVDARWIPKD